MARNPEPNPYVKGPLEPPEPDHKHFNLYCLARLNAAQRQHWYRFNRKYRHFTNLSKRLTNPHRTPKGWEFVEGGLDEDQKAIDRAFTNLDQAAAEELLS